MRFFTTDRLMLRNLEAADCGAIHAWRNDPACAAYQRWEAFTTEAIANLIAAYEQDVFLSEKEEQHFAVCSNTNGQPIGELSYFYTPNDCITLGITIAPYAQRQGYACEILSEVIRRIRQVYPTMELIALIEAGNEASMQLFEKLGFHQDCYAPSIESYVYLMAAD